MLDLTDHAEAHPLCQMCHDASVVWVVQEELEGRWRTYLLCHRCLHTRALLWERFAMRVQVSRFDREQSK